MVLDWLTGKDIPQFWKQYLAHFDKEEQNGPKRYVIFDTETTGLDWKDDVILSIGAISVINDEIKVGDFFEAFLKQDVFNPENAILTGILKEGKEEKIIEAEAIIRFLDFIKDATLVGHNINFDVEMINQALKRLNLGKLKNTILDVDVMYQKFKNLPEDKHHNLDELCDIFKIKKSDRHTASGDAYIIALLFLKLKRKLKL